MRHRRLVVMRVARVFASSQQPSASPPCDRTSCSWVFNPRPVSQSQPSSSRDSTALLSCPRTPKLSTYR
eukprot:74251-Heterocapsa_arctica.AAC.1